MRLTRLVQLAALFGAAFALDARSVAAQGSPVFNPPPRLVRASPPDTVIIVTFNLANGATYTSATPMTLNMALTGQLAPADFRVSKYSDFRDASWRAFPTSGAPTWSGFSQSGGCGSGSLRIVGFVQVRGFIILNNEGQLRPVQSNVAKDTTCFMIGG